MSHQARHARLHVGEPYLALRDASPDVATVVSIVYVTADPTFSGPIAGYTTLELSAESTSVGEPHFFAGTSSTMALVQTTAQVVPSRAQRPDRNPSTSLGLVASTPTVISAPTTALIASNLPLDILTAPASSDAAPSSSIVLNAAPGGAAPAASQSATSNNYEGMSGGAKAGLVCGLIAAFALVFALIFFMHRRRKARNDRHRQLNDEKSTSTFHQPQASMASIESHVSVRRTQTLAPRLSLRPVTEMFPSPNMEQKQGGAGSSAVLTPPAPAGRFKSPSSDGRSDHSGSNGWERRERRDDNRFNHNENPFGDHAGGAHNLSDHLNQTSSALDTTVAAVPKPLNVNFHRPGNGPINYDGTAGGVATGGGRPLSAERNNIHRVHLDFLPSMDDELELHAGRLVRMLHEYDDGWALCVRLDRSQQGVVPRTCISKLPVKPRPAGPPPGMRGAPRGAPQGRPRGPPEGYTQSPLTTTMSPTSSSGLNTYLQHTSMSPVGARARSKSNGPVSYNAQSQSTRYGDYQNTNQVSNRPRANSASSRRPIPSGTSSLNQQASFLASDGVLPIRKPVPGQAI